LAVISAKENFHAIMALKDIAINNAAGQVSNVSARSMFLHRQPN
jgi:hypothetical protein